MLTKRGLIIWLLASYFNIIILCIFSRSSLQMQDMTQVVLHNTPLFQLYLTGMNNVITILTVIDNTPYLWDTYLLVQ